MLLTNATALHSFFLVCSFLSLVTVVYYIFEMIFLMVHHLMMNASKFKCSHDVCALLHPSELTFNRNYRKSVVLITATAFVCLFFVVVRTLRFELQQQWKLHRRQDIGEKWHQPIALNSIGGGAWTAYKIKPEFNVECCIYCCCCRRFQGGSFSHDESQTLHSLIAHNIQFQVYYL